VSATEDDDAVAESVLSYLAEHPQAMDTLEGIAEWWIAREQVRVNVTTLGRVVRRLTEIGVLEEIVAGDQTRYRLRS
jgi:Fe2+ or Zn2+ uptake regulation protein